ncbi:hypothetical protein GJ496_000913 [Pomphorhynchus laevis]|nr:hypothetical protein GJ496_000913 [Pomphorhynchus laevis]
MGGLGVRDISVMHELEYGWSLLIFHTLKSVDSREEAMQETIRTIARQKSNFWAAIHESIKASGPSILLNTIPYAREKVYIVTASLIFTILFICRLSSKRLPDEQPPLLTSAFRYNTETVWSTSCSPLSPFIFSYNGPTTDYDESLISVNNHKPIPPLIQLNYDDVLNEWLSYVGSSIMNKSNGHVIYSCDRIGCGGWADRIKGIISAFILSVILQRGLLISVDHPCKLTSVLFPNDSKFAWHQNLRDVNGSSIFLKLVGNSEDRQLVRSSIQQQNYTYLQSFKKLYITGNDLLFDLVMSDSFDQDQFANIDKRYMVLENFYPQLYNRLFTLVQPLTKEKDTILSQQIGNATLICAQMRIGKSSTIPKDVEMLKSKHRNNMLNDMISFIQANLSKNYGNYKIFITTDSEEIRQIAKDRLKELMVDIPGEITHLDRSDVTKACQNFKKVILDFEMLSYCHTSLISNSGFGYFGNLRRPKPFQNLYIYCRKLHIVNSKREWDLIRWKNQPC